MTAVGEKDYLRFKAAQFMGDAGKSGGGEGSSTAESGMGLGLGAGFGMMVPSFLRGALEKEQKGVANGDRCPQCDAHLPEDARFCFKCGTPAVIGQICSECSIDLPADARFCSRCGVEVKKQSRVCSKCDGKVPQGARFCLHCGEKVE